MNRCIFIWSIVLLSCFSSDVWSQDQAILDFSVKELDGNVVVFKDRLKPNQNYLIETMAFWCNPCVRSINKFNYHKNYWKERFDLDIVLIEDEHWDDLQYVEDEMAEFGWDLDIVVSDKQFIISGINSIPRYYFKGAASDTLERVYGNIENFLLERVDSIKFDPILTNDFKQVTSTVDCDQLKTSTFKSANDTLINGQAYFMYNDMPLRESNQNGNIYKYDVQQNVEELHVKFSAALCSEFWLKDFEGDSILIKVLDRYQEGSVLHLVTNQMVVNECDEEEYVFEFVQNIGTNAGLDFNIEEGQIVSSIVCHRRGDELIYVNNSLSDLCQSLTSTTQSISPQHIKIFPNPVQNTFTVLLDFEGTKDIELYSTNGQQLISTSTKSSKLNFNLPTEASASIYFLKVTTKDGVVTKKIVKVQD